MANTVNTYVVMAERGKWDDREEWPVAVYLDRQQAIDHADRATAASVALYRDDWAHVLHAVYLVAGLDAAPVDVAPAAYPDRPEPVYTAHAHHSRAR